MGTSFETFYSRFVAPQREQAKSTDKLSAEQLQQLAEFDDLMEEVIPKSGWEAIDGTSVSAQFRKDFFTALDAGNVDQFAANVIHQSGYESFYTARATSTEGFNGSELEVWENHQPENALGVAHAIEILIKSLDTSLNTIPEFIKDEYRLKLDQALRYASAATKIGTPAFTKEHLAPSRWSQLIDQESLVTGELQLTYETDALAMLDDNKERAQELTQFARIDEALATWNFSLEEHQEFNLSGAELIGETLDSERIAQFFRILMKREPKLSQWRVVVDESKISIVVNGNTRIVYIPRSRVFTPKDLVSIPAHEFVHVVGSENAFQQPLIIFRRGMEDYSQTEEGKAVFAELIAGQKFNDPRQVKLAARYYAVAMAMKTRMTDDGFVAKYSMQEIYDTLLSKKVDANTAKEIIWRIMRGTSLRRKVVSVSAHGLSLPIAEVYPKDAIYFEGQIRMFDIFMDALPLSDHDRKRLELLAAKDISGSLLSRIGRQVFLGDRSSEEQRQQLDAAAEREQSRQIVYQKLSDLGKDALYDLLQYSLVGQINWDTFQQTGWENIVNRDPSNMAMYRKVMRGSSQE